MRRTHNVYLDFSDRNLELSYESFHENNSQTLEVSKSGESMCIVAQLAKEAEVFFSAGKNASTPIRLGQGEHRIDLDSSVTSGEGKLTIYICEKGQVVVERTYILVENFNTAYSAFMFRLYQHPAAVPARVF